MPLLQISEHHCSKLVGYMACHDGMPTALQAAKDSDGSAGTTCNVTRHAAKAVNGSLDELEFDLDWCAHAPHMGPSCLPGCGWAAALSSGMTLHLVSPGRLLEMLRECRAYVVL
jgi:hypothetical protein